MVKAKQVTWIWGDVSRWKYIWYISMILIYLFHIKSFEKLRNLYLILSNQAACNDHLILARYHSSHPSYNIEIAI